MWGASSEMPFVWDPTESAATRPLVWFRGGDAAYYTHDGNKNVSEVVAYDGTLAAHDGYAPFGAVTVRTGALASANPFRFSSEYADDELNLVYYNYRHYDPMVGRWYTRDLVFELGAQNLYLFVEGDPLNKFDFYGACPALLLFPGTWVAVGAFVKATVAAVVTVVVVEVASNVYQAYKEECGKCVTANLEVRHEIRTRESRDDRLNDCIESCWRWTLPSRNGDAA